MYAFAYLFYVDTGKTVAKCKSWYCNGCAIVTLIGWCWTTGVPVAGIGFTGALASVPPKRGDHRYGPLSYSLFTVKSSGPLHTHLKELREKNDDFDVPHRHELWWLLQLWVGLTLYVIPKWASWGLEASEDFYLLSKVQQISWFAPISPKGKPPRLPHGLVENLRFTQIPSVTH